MKERRARRVFQRVAAAPPEARPRLGGIQRGGVKGRVDYETLIRSFTSPINYNPVQEHHASSVALAENSKNKQHKQKQKGKSDDQIIGEIRILSGKAAYWLQ